MAAFKPAARLAAVAAAALKPVDRLAARPMVAAVRLVRVQQVGSTADGS